MRVALLAATIALFLLLAGFFSVYYDTGPQGMYAHYAGEQKTQVTVIFHFLNSHGNIETLSFLDENEQSHMMDVRRVLNGFRVIFAVLIMLVLLQLYLIVRLQTTSKKNKSCALRRSLLWGGVGALALAALLALSSLIDFTSFWTAFHLVLFPQGNWQFPYTSALITLFPEQFFEAYAQQVLLATTAYGLLCCAASLIYSERN